MRDRQVGAEPAQQVHHRALAAAGPFRDGSDLCGCAWTDGVSQAQPLCSASGLWLTLPMQDHVDFALFSERSRIGHALQKAHSCTDALVWCGENRGTLKKTKVGADDRGCRHVV